MLIQTFFKSLTSTPKRRRPIRRRPPALRLCLETLEDRCLLSFSPAVNYPVGLGPTAVVTGDFNGDGKLDLAVINTNSNTVSILLGKGDGTFQPAQNFAAGAHPRSLAVGDFNKDGKLDIVVANDNGVSVLLDNGNGTFQAPINSSLLDPNGGFGLIPVSVAVGDFNGDGKLDLVVASLSLVSAYYGSSYPGAVVDNVLLGHGDGTFGAPSASVVFSGQAVNGASVAVGDFNGDGKLDFVTGYDAMFSRGVVVALGTGTGTFGAGSYFGTGSIGSMAVGDVNGDGKLDIVTGCGGVSVFLGNGNGSFGAAHNYASSVGMSKVALADFNGDGKLDIVGADTGGVSVLLGPGDGSFFARPVNAAAGTDPFGVAVGDFNGDGRPDLAVVNYASNNVSVLINDGSWPVLTREATSFTVSGFPSSTTAGTAGSFTVTAKYPDGTTATGYTGTVHFSSSDGQAGLPANYTFAAADAGMHTFSAILKTAGTQWLVVTDATYASYGGSESGITVNPAAVSKLDVAGLAGGTLAGSAFQVTVTALDPYNNIATSYTGTIHFTSTDAQAGLDGDYTFTAGDAGQQFFGAILKTAGSQSITATDTVTSSITGSTVAVTIFPAPASTLIVAGFPSPITAGVAGNFTVTLKDPYGNFADYTAHIVHFTSSDIKAVLPANYAFTAADAGVHTFSAILKTAGTQSITVADATITSLTGTDGGITVNPAASTMIVTGFPSSTTAGTAGNFSITAKKADGTTATNYTGTVHFSSSDGKAVLPADYTFTGADAGVHTFSATLKTAGTQSITVKDTVTGTITGTEAGITVKPAAASKFILSAPYSVNAGIAFSLTVRVQDAYGNVVTGYTGTIHFTSTDGTASLPANYTFTAADKGVHTFTGLVLRKKGTQKITLTDTLTNSLTGSVIENVL